jgi:hypothetical protein
MVSTISFIYMDTYIMKIRNEAGRIPQTMQKVKNIKSKRVAGYCTYIMLHTNDISLIIQYVTLLCSLMSADGRVPERNDNWMRRRTIPVVLAELAYTLRP